LREGREHRGSEAGVTGLRQARVWQACAAQAAGPPAPHRVAEGVGLCCGGLAVGGEARDLAGVLGVAEQAGQACAAIAGNVQPCRGRARRLGSGWAPAPGSRQRRERAPRAAGTQGGRGRPASLRSQPPFRPAVASCGQLWPAVAQLRTVAGVLALGDGFEAGGAVVELEGAGGVERQAACAQGAARGSAGARAGLLGGGGSGQGPGRQPRAPGVLLHRVASAPVSPA
jgi:hypothetical protein